MSGTKRFCTQCGTQANEGDLFCAACGAKLKAPIRKSDDTGSTVPDKAVSDHPAPEKAAPQSAPSEKAPSGSAAPASTVPDKAVPDRPTPEKAAPQSSPSEKAFSGSSASGSAVPDKAVPDRSAPEKAAPQSAPSKKASSGSTAPAATPKPAAQSRPVSGAGTSGSDSSRIPASQKEKPRSKAKRFLITLVVIALGWGAGKLLGGGLARDYSRNTNLTTKSPIATVVPGAIQTKSRQSVVTKKPQSTATKKPQSVVTKKPQPTATKKPAQTKKPTATPRNTVKSQQYWNYLEAEDFEIRETMVYFWYGHDSSTGANCAFFTDSQAKRGGYCWYNRDGTKFEACFTVGTFVDPKPNSDVVVDGDGDRTRLTLITRKDGSIDFNFGDPTYIKGTVNLKPDKENKEQILKLILNYVHTQQKFKKINGK